MVSHVGGRSYELGALPVVQIHSHAASTLQVASQFLDGDDVLLMVEQIHLRAP